MHCEYFIAKNITIIHLLRVYVLKCFYTNFFNRTRCFVIANMCLLADLPRGDDPHRLGWLARLATHPLNRLYHIEALQHLAKHHMLAVQPGGGNGGNEELRALGVGAGVGHAQVARSLVLDLEVLV